MSTFSYQWGFIRMVAGAQFVPFDPVNQATADRVFRLQVEFNVPMATFNDSNFDRPFVVAYDDEGVLYGWHAGVRYRVVRRLNSGNSNSSNLSIAEVPNGPLIAHQVPTHASFAWRPRGSDSDDDEDTIVPFARYSMAFGDSGMSIGSDSGHSSNSSNSTILRVNRMTMREVLANLSITVDDDDDEDEQYVPPSRRRSVELRRAPTLQAPTGYQAAYWRSYSTPVLHETADEDISSEEERQQHRAVALERLVCSRCRIDPQRCPQHRIRVGFLQPTRSTSSSDSDVTVFSIGSRDDAH
ncbi:hypothetical protein BC940DRAFT_338177 [Gongronella butleri]|nr:hypothetical protein BC940DRAFT_338177 [Gongronella butleri]